jgi:hypothetical protein
MRTLIVGAGFRARFRASQARAERWHRKHRFAKPRATDPAAPMRCRPGLPKPCYGASASAFEPVNTSARMISRVFSGSSKNGVWADCLKV